MIKNTERSNNSGSIRLHLQLIALYAGGFLGPFGGGVVVSVLPEIGNDFGVGPSAAASTLTAYLLPFAAMMLVSGTLGARWGQTRTVRAAYGFYLVASIACFLAPTLEIFLAARVLQGCSNAFTTPLLLASLAASIPKANLGRALGTFGAFQAAGQSFAPLIGGLAAEFDWRLSFLAIAAVAGVLGIIGLPVSERAAATPPARLRDALRPDVLRIGIVAFLGWGALGGLSFLLSFRFEDEFAMSPTARGLMLTLFGLAGILAAKRAGILIDRIGARASVTIGAMCGAALVVVVGVASIVPVIAIAWFVAGVASQFVLVGVNAAVLGSQGPNRAGAVSVVQAMRFGGAALVPMALTPIYDLSTISSFLIPAGLLAVVAPLIMPNLTMRKQGAPKPDTTV